MSVAAARNIDVAVDDAAWTGSFLDAAAACRRAADAALAEAAPGGPVELSILLADDATVVSLNRRYRGCAGATNVLAFPGSPALAPGAPGVLGDVVLARETVCREARARGLAVADHARHLVVHGTLHLLGYDHRDDREAAEMRGAETRVLRRIGVADPWQSGEWPA